LQQLTQPSLPSLVLYIPVEGHNQSLKGSYLPPHLSPSFSLAAVIVRPHPAFLATQRAFQLSPTLPAPTRVVPPRAGCPTCSAARLPYHPAAASRPYLLNYDGPSPHSGSECCSTPEQPLPLPFPSLTPTPCPPHAPHPTPCITSCATSLPPSSST
jgi:hypothetical protein